MTVLRSIEAAAFVSGRNPKVIRRWYLEGIITTVACDCRTKAILVDLAEVAEVSLMRRTRRVA